MPTTHSAMQTFYHSSRLSYPAARLFEWHARPGAFGRLLPPWQRATLQSGVVPLVDGTVVDFHLHRGPFSVPWRAEHRDVQPGRQFVDDQVRGPFRYWSHLHEFSDEKPGSSILTDRIEFRLPGLALGDLLLRSSIRRELTRTFEYRHRVLAQDLDLHQRFAERPRLRVAVTGASGLIGSALVDLLTTGGHEVVRLSRTPEHGEFAFDPENGRFDPEVLPAIDALVHLAGENVAARRWSPRQRDRIASSRINGTRALVNGFDRMRCPPRIFVCASAIGLYGDRGTEPVDESCAPGSGFLADLGFSWEAEAMGALDFGVRTVLARFGIVLSPRGGTLAKMMLPFRLGLGGRMGSGDQIMSWVSIEDAVAILYHLLMDDFYRGPVNITAPQPVSNRDFTRALAKALRRPALLPVPAHAARAAFGEIADEVLLAGVCVLPGALLSKGYQFRHPTIELALRQLLGHHGNQNR